MLISEEDRPSLNAYCDEDDEDDDHKSDLVVALESIATAVSAVADAINNYAVACRNHSSSDD